MKKLLIALMMAAAMGASAELKIATVNMVDLVRLHPTHESNKQLVKTTDKDYKAKLDKMQEEMKSLADEGKKIQEDLQNPMLSNSAKADAQKKMDGIQQKFIAGQQELRQAAQRFQSDLSDLEQRLIKLETDDIRAKISAFAKENNYDIIADSTMLAFSKDSLDVTDEILKAMKVDPAKRKEKKAPSNEGK